MHSGDSACAIPPPTLPPWVVEVIEAYTAAIADRLDVRGLINVQYAVAGTTVYVIEANPRASRTVPFVAKATGRAAGQGGHAGDARRHARRAAHRGTAAASRLIGRRHGRRQGGRAAVLPVPRGRPGARAGDALDRRGDGHRPHVRAGVPQGRAGRRDDPADHGTVFLSLADIDKPAGLVVAKRLRELGLGVVATQGHGGLPRPLRQPRRRGRRQGQRGRAARRPST